MSFLTNRSVSTLFALLVATSAPASCAMAQPILAEIIAGECRIRSIAPSASSAAVWKAQISKFKLHWSGSCVDGLASGPGQLKQEQKDDLSESQTITEGVWISGVLHGFARVTSEFRLAAMGNPGEPFYFPSRSITSTFWMFSDGKSTTAVLSGLGLEGFEDLLRNDASAMPRRVTDYSALSQGETQISISTGSRILQLWRSSCTLDPATFPECSGSTAGMRTFDVYFFLQVTEDSPAIYTDTSARKYCPAPRDRASCALVAPLLVDPLVVQVEDSIKAFWKRLETSPALATAVRRAK